MSNQLQPQAQRPKFSVALQTDGYKKLINNTLQDPRRAQRFIASISSAVAVNPALQDCDAGSILSGALLGESLNLSPSPQLGQYYLVPFDCAIKDASGNDLYVMGEDGKPAKNDKGYKIKQTIKKAQFIIGFHGMIQLAIRSGQYKKLNVLPLKKGELVHYDPLNEEIEVKMIQDEIQREVAPTTGYYAMFEYVNGFKKVLYWSREKMDKHALQYSAGYKSDKAKGYNYTFWSKNFDDMACKTMLRQIIGKWGIMSIEMRDGMERDDSIINQDGSADYIAGEDIKLLANETQAAVNEIEPEASEAEQTEMKLSDV